MATPTDYIFQSASVQKGGLYQFMIDKMKAAGWQDISSNPTTDFVVLRSTGVNEDKNLVIQLRPLPAAGTVANNVTTSNFSQMSYRLVDSYTPGASGAAGTFGRSSLAWTDLYLIPAAVNTQLAMDTVCNVKWYADAGKFIMAIEYPPATGYGPMLIYIGQPDSSYVAESNSAGLLVGVTANAPAATSVQIDNTSDGSGSVTAPYVMATQSLLPTQNPNNANKYVVSDIYYGNSTEGVRGKLDGVGCMLNNGNVLTGDNIVVDIQTYYVLVCKTQANTSFPTPALVIRIV
ncbi:MAG TPA: hypothetical protein PKA10_18400 [Selenomonadales bacterium]|nr:hypothetical protein [Selenomonadales bacterium]